jgi:hypothetical protein
MPLALKARSSRHPYFYHALSALQRDRPCYLGRCPRLSRCAPLALPDLCREVSQIYEYRKNHSFLTGVFDPVATARGSVQVELLT